MNVEKLSSTALNEVGSAQQLQHCAMACWLCALAGNHHSRCRNNPKNKWAETNSRFSCFDHRIAERNSQRFRKAGCFFSVTFEMKSQMLASFAVFFDYTWGAQPLEKIEKIATENACFLKTFSTFWDLHYLSFCNWTREMHGLYEWLCPASEINIMHVIKSVEVWACFLKALSTFWDLHYLSFCNWTKEHMLCTSGCVLHLGSTSYHARH